MPRYIRIAIAAACLLCMTLVYAQGSQPRIWVALSEEGGPYAESAAVLRAELADRSSLVIGKWPVTFADRRSPPDLVITVGMAAFEGVLDNLESRGAEWAGVPVLATLLPRSGYEARLKAMQKAGRPVSAVVLDQPADRQLALIARALPDRRRVGVLSGSRSQALVLELQQAAAVRRMGLDVITGVTAPETLFPALKGVLETADVILSIPDPTVYHAGSLQNILLTTYRARVPLVAFSPAYVKAGAILAVYSTPAQVARHAVGMVRSWQASGSLPPMQMPAEFAVSSNPKVAASLGISLDDAAEIAEDLRRGGGR
ncbi:MAG: ABC transporter substrate binding protein [Rhodocyclaceae bacterium]|nr:ABC transporter substrate binding protein [Rhodocyclaceae bacterium]